MKYREKALERLKEPRTQMEIDTKCRKAVIKSHETIKYRKLERRASRGDRRSRGKEKGQVLITN